TQRDKMQTLLARPGRADLIGGAVPERRMRLLQRAQLDRHILIAVVLAFVGKAIGRQTGADTLESIDENVARAIVLAFVYFSSYGETPRPMPTSSRPWLRWSSMQISSISRSGEYSGSK